jgi:hypothetical protein
MNTVLFQRDTKARKDRSICCAVGVACGELRRVAHREMCAADDPSTAKKSGGVIDHPANGFFTVPMSRYTNAERFGSVDYIVTVRASESNDSFTTMRQITIGDDGAFLSMRTTILCMPWLGCRSSVGQTDEMRLYSGPWSRSKMSPTGRRL